MVPEILVSAASDRSRNTGRMPNTSTVRGPECGTAAYHAFAKHWRRANSMREAC
jgi:hypothetical protein